MITEEKNIIWNLVEDNHSMIRRRKLYLHEQLADSVLEIKNETHFEDIDWKKHIIPHANKEIEIKELYENFFIPKHEFIETYEDIKLRITRANKIVKEYELIMQSGILDDLDRIEVYGV